MTVHVPIDVEGAVAARVSDPDAMLLAGGTDLMVEVNFGHRKPRSIIRLDEVDELTQISIDETSVEIGAMVTHAELCEEPFISLVPALAMAARTVGSPQIRNAGTIGGNVATSSPAGDTLPVLLALEATVVLVGTNGERRVPIADFFTGPKRNVMASDEIIRSLDVPIVLGAQEFVKVGTRNAMVIAVANLALVVDSRSRRLRCALGSVGPTPLRATDAERWADAYIERVGFGDPSAEAAQEFGALVGAAARPIDDQRSTADYRRHAVKVCAARVFRRAMRETRGS
ncbi:MAG: xanthine dehydrogenase family protein subunit M [Acidimicrobiia bacterium]